MIGMGPGGTLLQLIAGLPEHAGNGLGAGGQGRATQKQGGNPFTAPVWVGLFEHEDGAAGGFGQSAAGRTTARGVHQTGGTLGVELVFPGVKSMLGDAHQGSEISCGQAASAPGVQDEQALLGGQG